MHFSTIALSTVAALTPLAAAVGSAIVENHCVDPVYLWSVGGAVGDQQTIDAGGVYSEEFHYDDQTGGIALKITRTEGGIFDGSPQLIYAYTLAGELVYYDLSAVFGDAFEGEALLVSPANTDCEEISWPDGVPPVGASRTQTCGADGDVTLTLCAA